MQDDLAKVEAMKEANWKPAVQYWREQSETKQTRIEQLTSRVADLERELEEAREGWHVEMPNAHSMQAELAAEKALADRFGLAMQVSNSELQAALLAWRKARGL